MAINTELRRKVGTTFGDASSLIYVRSHYDIIDGDLPQHYQSITDSTGTAHRLFYTDGQGDMVQLALGAANTVLRGNGTTSAPSFGAIPYATSTVVGGAKYDYNNTTGILTISIA